MTAKEFVQSIKGRACPTVWNFAVGILEKNDWDFRSLFSDAVEREYKQLPTRELHTFETSLAWAVWKYAPYYNALRGTVTLDDLIDACRPTCAPNEFNSWFHMAVNYPGNCRDVRWNRAKKAMKAAGITHYSPKKTKKEILR